MKNKYHIFGVPIVPISELHPVDVDEFENITEPFYIEAENQELALDEYHWSQPIKVLDHFEIKIELSKGGL